MSAKPIPRRGQFSTGLVATPGGMAPSSNHPGLRPSHQPTFKPANREHLPTDEARSNKETNLMDSQTANTAAAFRAPSARARAKHTPAPTGRRHLDPHHFTNLSDEAKRQEGRLGRAHVRPPHSSSQNRTQQQQQPADARHTIHNRNLETSVQLAEARLRRIANGKGAVGGDPAKREAYRAAAQEVLTRHRGDAGLVEQEQALAHRLASDAYACESAQRQAATEERMRHRYASPSDGTGKREGEERSGGLGSPAPVLVSMTPYALDDSRPRADTDTTVTGGHGVRITKDHNRDHFPIPGCPIASTGDVAARDSEGRRAAAEESRRQQNEKYYSFRGMNSARPYDDFTAAGESYPTPPPVGVSVGIYQKPRMVRSVPSHHNVTSEDRDTAALKRAQAQAPYNRVNRESSPSMDRPDFVTARTETSQPQQQTHHRAPVTLRERTEARWKREEAERENRRVGKSRVAAQNRHTPLW